MRSDEAIYDLIGLYVSGEVSPEAAMEVEDWASESPDKEAFLKQCCKIYRPTGVDPDAALKTQTWKKIESQITPMPPMVVKPRLYRALGIAASILVLVMIIAFLLNRKQNDIAPLVYAATDKSRKIQLPDGTEIYLDPFARVVLQQEYGVRSRQLTLEGTASFSVKHDAARTFIVTIGRLHIQDAGTRFTVNSAPGEDEIRVAVQEGAVIVFDDRQQSRSLQAGEAFVYWMHAGVFGKTVVSFRDSANWSIRDTLPFAKSNDPAIDIAKGSKALPRAIDTTEQLTLAEVERIVGGPVELGASNTDENDGLLKLSRQYRLLADPSINLYNEVEHYGTPEAARKAYQDHRVKFSSLNDPSLLIAEQALGFEHAVAGGTYLLVLQKGDVVMQVRTSKPIAPSARQVLLQILKRKAQAIR